jgi:hypothetical protein
MRRVTLLVPAALLLVGLATPSVQAGAPVITRDYFEGVTHQDDVCGFPVEFYARARIVTHLWEDADGNLRIMEAYPQERYTLTNLDTGKSISFSNAGPWFYRYDAATGVSTEKGTGSFMFGIDVHPPYDPGIFRSRGNWIWVYDLDGNELLWRWVGKVDDLCPQLAS